MMVLEGKGVGLGEVDGTFFVSIQMESVSFENQTDASVFVSFSSSSSFLQDQLDEGLRMVWVECE